MALSIEEQEGGRILSVKLSGTLGKGDYENFVPEVERLIQKHGKIRMIVDMHDFHGWDMGALWEDIKFDLKHFKDIGRLAIVGETKWQEWMSKFCNPFTAAEIRYFDHDQADRANAWIQV